MKVNVKEFNSAIINKNLFQVEFEFGELKSQENMILNELLTKVTEDYMEFNLQSINKIVQPLDILIGLKNNKTIGNVTIKMINKESEVLAIFKFKAFKVSEINNVIDFDLSEEDFNKSSEKTLSIRFNYDDILYSSSAKDSEKLT